jgi:hypothetical protein
MCLFVCLDVFANKMLIIIRLYIIPNAKWISQDLLIRRYTTFLTMYVASLGSSASLWCSSWSILYIDASGNRCNVVRTPCFLLLELWLHCKSNSCNACSGKPRTRLGRVVIPSCRSILPWNWHQCTWESNVLRLNCPAPCFLPVSKVRSIVCVICFWYALL